MSCDTGKTWLPRIKCGNFQCNVKPQTKYIPIRKSQREKIAVIREKIEKVIKLWNDGNLIFKNEGFELDYEKIVQNYKSGKLGLPGYRE